MSGVTAIRQRKQWTADLTTLTDGNATWATGSGTPETTSLAWASVINISGNTESSGGSGNVASWSASWSDTQQPRYTKLTAEFALTFTVGSGLTGGWGTALQQFSPSVSDTGSGSGGVVTSTLEIDLVPSARPTEYKVSFFVNEADTVNTTVSGTITLTWS